ncbi:TPA: hypothetical protein VME96_000749 [Streptococcus pyogenes]|nr:hypothetical protein [Streptococcus pyogenes]
MTNEREKEEAKVALRRTFTSDSGDSFGIENCPKLELFCFFWRWYACQLDQTS